MIAGCGADQSTPRAAYAMLAGICSNQSACSPACPILRSSDSLRLNPPPPPPPIKCRMARYLDQKYHTGLCCRDHRLECCRCCRKESTRSTTSRVVVRLINPDVSSTTTDRSGPCNIDLVSKEGHHPCTRRGSTVSSFSSSFPERRGQKAFPPCRILKLVSNFETRALDRGQRTPPQCPFEVSADAAHLFANEERTNRVLSLARDFLDETICNCRFFRFQTRG